MATFQFDYGLTGRTLYAFERAAGSTSILSTVAQAYVAYSVSDWTNYDQAMTEASGSGSYFGTFQTYDVAGWKQFSVYRQLGGSPASTDPLVGSGTVYYLPADTPAPGNDQTAAATFYFHTADEADLVSQTAYKNAGDTVWLVWSAVGLPEVRDGGATISTAVLSVSGSGVTISGQETGTVTVGAFYAGGTAATDYVVTITATLSDGTVYVRTGPLSVS